MSLRIVIQRCVHGNIIVACPHDDCPTRTAYFDQMNASIRDHRSHHSAGFVCPECGPVLGPEL